MKLQISRFSDKLFYPVLFFIIAVSYRLYSSRYYSALNSDDTLSILMTQYYKLPHDIYCWGQDRGGTLVPLISQLFFRGFHFSAVNSVSITNYLLLIIGFIGFSDLLKNKSAKIIFAIFWFLPPLWYIDMLRFPYGMEYCLIAVGIFIINRLNFNPAKNLSLKQHLLLLCLVLIFIISIWVSDLAAVSIAVLLFVLYTDHYLRAKKNFPRKEILFYFFIGILLCSAFILHAKNGAENKSIQYASLNGIDDIIIAAKITMKVIYSFLTFKSNELFMCIYVYLVIALLIYISYTFKKQRVEFSEKIKKWFLFFILDGVIIYGVIFLSHWASMDGFGRRFFICNYISFGIAAFIAFDQLITSQINSSKVKFLFLITVITGAVSTVYHLKYIFPKSLISSVDKAMELKSLGKIGVVGEYWNSYIVSCADPEQVMASPHDKSNVKNPSLTDSVFECKNIYLIKDNWMDVFPDSIVQFGYPLKREGREFISDDRTMCKYKKVKLNKYIFLTDLTFDISRLQMDTSIAEEALYIPKECKDCIKKYVLSGPKMLIGKGDFTAAFSLKATNITNDTIAELSVAANWGGTILAKRILTKKDFSDDKYQSIDLNFKTEKRLNDLEFRILYYKDANLYFNKINVKEK
ncbi:MAG: hypothetical protein ACXVDZ_09570 [Bacteroidia bacterium]